MATTSINKRLCQHTVNESIIQSTRAGLERRHLAFAVANCVLNRRFAVATVGSCGDCLKLRRVAGKACNMTENALSIVIVIFSIQLQQTKISDRKLLIFQHGFMPDRKKYSLLRDTYFCEDSRIHYLHSKSLNMRSE